MTVCLPLLLLPVRYSVGMARIICSGVIWLLKVIAGVDHEIRGLEHLTPGPLLIASKHQSAWETIFFQVLMPGAAFVLKKELTLIPLLGQFIRKFKMIPIGGKSNKTALLKMFRIAEDAKQAKRYIIVFPEGMRTNPGESVKYQRGIAVLYKRLEIPVVPVALNAGLFWQRKSLFKTPGTIVIEFLPPIKPGLAQDEFMEQLAKSIEENSNRLLEENTNVETEVACVKA